MPVEDAIRWNERYSDPSGSGWSTEPRDFLLAHLEHLPERGLALDIAMGVGANAGVLIERGLDVIGVDITPVAVSRAQKANPRLSAVIGDLENLRFPERSFDVILDLYYLQRRWVMDFSRLLKPGGWVVMETLTRDIQVVKPEIPDEYLLGKGELLALFAGWDVKVYREGWFRAHNGKRKAVAGIVARLSQGQGVDE